MGSFSIWHWLVVGVIVLLLFGKGRISDVMGDLAKGIKSFKKGIADDDVTPPPAPPKQINSPGADVNATSESEHKTPQS